MRLRKRKCDTYSSIIPLAGTTRVGAITPWQASPTSSITEKANAPIFRIYVNNNVTEWNKKAAEITGYSKEEAFNKPLVSSFIVPSLHQSVQEVMDQALLGNETSNYELQFETKSKEIRYLLVNDTTRRDAEYKARMIETCGP